MFYIHITLLHTLGPLDPWTIIFLYCSKEFIEISIHFIGNYKAIIILFYVRSNNYIDNCSLLLLTRYRPSFNSRYCATMPSTDSVRRAGICYRLADGASTIDRPDSVSMTDYCSPVLLLYGPTKGRFGRSPLTYDSTQLPPTLEN